MWTICRVKEYTKHRVLIISLTLDSQATEFSHQAEYLQHYPKSRCKKFDYPKSRQKKNGCCSCHNFCV